MLFRSTSTSTSRATAFPQERTTHVHNTDRYSLRADLHSSTSPGCDEDFLSTLYRRSTNEVKIAPLVPLYKHGRLSSERHFLGMRAQTVFVEAIFIFVCTLPRQKLFLSTTLQRGTHHHHAWTHPCSRGLKSQPPKPLSTRVLPPSRKSSAALSHLPLPSLFTNQHPNTTF